MKPVRLISALVFVLVAVQLLAGCSSEVAIETEPSGKFTHFVDVYLKGTAIFGDLMDEEAGENLWLYPGDVLIINNTTDQEATVSFPKGLCEVLGKELPKLEGGLVKVTIKPRRRSMLMLLKKVTDDDAFNVMVGVVETVGAPKVKVGEGP